LVYQACAADGDGLMLKLYYSPGACALASHIALEEAGADYEVQAINLRAGEQKTPAFLAINPVGSTPDH
jgi:glutathione S-transferase